MVVAGPGAGGAAVSAPNPGVISVDRAGSSLSGVATLHASGLNRGGPVVAGDRLGDSAGTDWDLDWYVRRYALGGRVIWTKVWSPAGARAAVSDVAAPPLGPIYVGGRVGTLGELDGGSKWVVRQYARGGRLEWSRSGGDRCAETNVTGVAADRRGAVVSGYCFRASGTSTAWVRAFAADGALRWVRELRPPVRAERWVWALDVALGANGAAFVTGVVVSGDTNLSGDLDAVVAKLRANDVGSIAWVRKLPEGMALDRDVGRSVDVRQDAVVVLVWEPEAAKPALVVRMGLDGKRLWSRSLALDPRSVTVDGDGRPFVSGDGVVVGLSTAGVVRWRLPLHGDVRAIETGNGGLFAAGSNGDHGRAWRLSR